MNYISFDSLSKYKYIVKGLHSIWIKQPPLLKSEL